MCIIQAVGSTEKTDVLFFTVSHHCQEKLCKEVGFETEMALVSFFDRDACTL